MQKRFIEILRVLAKDLIEGGYDADDALKKINILDIDFLTLREDLLTMESAKRMDETELDTVRALLVYIMMKDTDLEVDEIYSFVFGQGRQIIWN